MICWICGEAEGATGEHYFKASDIKLLFPEFDPKKPLYVHKHDRRNIPIGSRKSNHLKSDSRLCEKCNNERTQKHDLAWSILSDYLYKNWNNIKQIKKIYLKRVFPNSLESDSLFLHLYFLKLFGCLLNQTLHTKLATEFSDSILNKKSHKDVFITLINSLPYGGGIGISDLHVDTDHETKELARAQWLYCIGNIWVRIFYINSKNYDLEQPNGWNPEKGSKIIKVINYREKKK